MNARPRGLDAIFAPRTVAVIGATERPGSVGCDLLHNLTAHSFGGTVFPVTPARASVMGIEAYPTIDAVPEPVDLAIIATPAPTVPDIVRACADVGVSAAIVISAGFRETGAAGAELEQRIRRHAARSEMRILGPNCLGIINPTRDFHATFVRKSPQRGTVAFISQSGSLGAAILDWSLEQRVGFSAFATLGSMLDLGFGDLIAYFGEDPETKAIVLAMESMGDARSFISSAREVARSKPIIVLKAGRTPEGARAVCAHIGASVGKDEAIEAAFDLCGLLRVETIADLFSMADVLDKQPRPRGNRLAIVTNAGGPGVLATDALINGGGRLALLSETTHAALDAALPPAWSRANPVDVLGDADAARFAHAMEIVARDENVNGILAVMAPQGLVEPTPIAKELARFAHVAQKPVLASWLGGVDVAEGAAILRQAGIPTFRYADTAARMFNYLWRFDENLRALYQTPLPPGDDAQDANAAAALLDAARAAGRTFLTETESRRLLELYGIPVARIRDAHRADGSYELCVSAMLDEQLGPVLAFGLGGCLADAIGDRSFALPPLNTTLAQRMMERTRIFGALRGAGGTPAVDLIALEQILVRFSYLVADQRAIRSVDINPLLAEPDQIAAVSIRVELHSAQTPASTIPPLAIRPYPTQYVGTWTLPNGEDVTIRPIRPDDEPLMRAFHDTISEQSVYMRYAHVLSLRERIRHERLSRLCFIDYDREMALIALRGEPSPSIVGVGRLVRMRGGKSAEFAVIISDAFQRRGLGTELLRRLVELAPREGVERVVGYILPENAGMQEVSRRLGFSLRYSEEYGMIEAEMLTTALGTGARRPRDS